MNINICQYNVCIPTSDMNMLHCMGSYIIALWLLTSAPSFS